MKTLIINIDNESTLEKFLTLAKKLHLKTKLIDTVNKTETSQEHEDWLKLAVVSLTNSYAEDEPDISEIQLKESNPEYKAWK